MGWGEEDFREPPLDWHVKGESVEDKVHHKQKNWKVCSGSDSQQIPRPSETLLYGSGGPGLGESVSRKPSAQTTGSEAQRASSYGEGR